MISGGIKFAQIRLILEAKHLETIPNRATILP